MLCPGLPLSPCLKSENKIASHCKCPLLRKARWSRATNAGEMLQHGGIGLGDGRPRGWLQNLEAGLGWMKQGREKNLSRNWIRWNYWGLQRFRGNEGEPCGQGETNREPGNLVHVHSVNKQIRNKWRNVPMNEWMVCQKQAAQTSSPIPPQSPAELKMAPFFAHLNSKSHLSRCTTLEAGSHHAHTSLRTSFQKVGEQLSHQPPSALPSTDGERNVTLWLPWTMATAHFRESV